MLKAIDLFLQGKHEELWQMCCGYLKLDINGFMDIQERLLLEQLKYLNSSPLGQKVLRGASPKTMEEFREQVPLTTYADYCPELEEKREDILPEKPGLWAHSSGKSGEYPCKWVPLPPKYLEELSAVLYGIGMLSCSDDWGDTSHIPKHIKILYSVAPRPYISGTFADVLRMQTPLTYMPSLEESENLAFEDRIKLGFQQSISQGLDYFFGLSLVLVSVGDKFLQSSSKVDLRPFLGQPKALWRLAKGKIRSRLAGRPLLPKDIWELRGIIGSGLDSWVYKDKIKELWGRKPLDLYSCTEGGVIATQTWDYEDMTFVPNLNFLEFIPEEETLKWQMDASYRPKTLLLNEVKDGECYEIVLTNFHGGAMTRYRVGDMVRITSLADEKTGIVLPQMAFERRVDDIIDFVFVRLNEKTIWQAIEKAGVEYVDWFAYRMTGESTLRIFIEPRGDSVFNKPQITQAIYDEFTRSDDDTKTLIPEEYASMMDFKVEVTALPQGTFSDYMAYKQSQGADLAHLKPPHVNPPEEALSLLLAEPEEVIVVTKTKTKSASATPDNRKTEAEKVTN